jgi:hypothetical protein
MATEAFYVKKEDVGDFKKAKELLGDDFSPFVMKCLKNYLIDVEKQNEGFDTIIILDGKRYPEDDTREGQNIQFIGKMLSSAAVDYGQGKSTVYELYLTRKGKVLLHKVQGDYTGFASEIYSYEVKDRIQDFKENKLPSELLSDAEKKMPGITCKVLDI